MGICWYSSKANSKLLLERLTYHPDYLQRLRWMQIPGLLFLRHFVFFFFLTTLSRKRFGLIKGFLSVLWRIAIRSSTRKGRNMCPGEVVCLSAGNVEKIVWALLECIWSEREAHDHVSFSRKNFKFSTLINVYPKILEVSSFTVYTFQAATTFLQSGVSTRFSF